MTGICRVGWDDGGRVESLVEEESAAVKVEVEKKNAQRRVDMELARGGRGSGGSTRRVLRTVASFHTAERTRNIRQ